MYFVMNIMNQAKDFDSPVFPKCFTEKMTEVFRNQAPVWWVDAFFGKFIHVRSSDDNPGEFLINVDVNVYTYIHI